jgi:hypothetical protein
MDCKRPHQHRALKLFLTVVGFLMLTSCTWVKDESDDCPYGFWLQLRYSYNMLDVDAAPKYVTDAHVYVYDMDGNFVKRIFVTQDVLKTHNYRVEVDDLPEGDYQFVVWSGMGNSQYAVSGDTQTIDDFRLALAGASRGSATELPALYHGYLSKVHYDDSYAVHEVELMKNTNQLACLVVSVDNAVEADPADYAMEVVAANGTMDAYNQLVSDEAIIYKPFVKEPVTIDDSDYGTLSGIKFNITTLRLMTDSDSRIILHQKSTGQVVFNISFPEYIGMIGALYTNMGRQISVQEYLDRQDFYTIVFFLSADMEQLIQLQVNSWRLRANHHLKL